MDAAYVAGIVDGEGCLTVGKNKKALTYDARIYIGMTKKGMPVLEEIHKAFSGSLTMHRKATQKWEEAWTWSVTGRKAAIMLRVIQPHLILKAVQARLLLQLEDMRAELELRPRAAESGKRGGLPKWTPEAREKAKAIRVTVMDLNRRGPPPQAIPRHIVPPDFVLVRDVDGELMEERAPDLYDDTLWQSFSGRFGNAGIVGSFGVLTGSISESPSADAGFSACSLASVLETEEDWLARHPGKTSEDFWTYLSKYYLSARAAAGILRRAEARGKALPPALEEALRAIAASTEPGGEEAEAE